MENPEEVLQALDEFQKMRPTEIPRELEEYLCWVAKTGDPVYQWSLIKALFREKLTRVMTDFYESCPSLDLTPCPNVETFNYDTMKSSLLERLDLFANAPFTVQRICELLTAPRKEYNRVDKFMRAIEKNILVVSTKEPGSTVRRNENGDGMVNGSVEDDALGGVSHEVEMDSWVKDCAASTVGMSVQTMDNGTRLLDDVTSTISKTGPAPNGGSLSPEKTAHTTIGTCEPSGMGFVPSTSDFSGQGSESRDSMGIGLNSRNLSTSIHEAPNIAGEVPEAIMNEDTSSQPSLDINSPESEPFDPDRKLQTTFQAKDFINHNSKSPELYEEEAKNTKKSDNDLTLDSHILPVEGNTELKASVNEQESVLPIVENFLQANSRTENSVIISGEVPSDQKPADVAGFPESDPSKEDFKLEISTSRDQDEPFANNAVEFQPMSSDEKVIEEKLKVEAVDSISTSSSDTEEISLKREVMQKTVKPKHTVTKKLNEESNELVIESIKEINAKSEEAGIENTTENSKPIIEGSFLEKGDRNDSSQDSKSSNLTIEESTKDDSTGTKFMIPGSIPSIEEPKEVEPAVEDRENELIEEVNSKIPAIKIESLTKNKPATIESVESSEIAISKEEFSARPDEPTKIRTLITEKEPVSELISELSPEKETKPAESMEVDGEESATIFQADEPMEQEVSEVGSR